MEKIIRLNNKEINIQLFNQGLINNSRPVLVFLHEALGSIIQWKSFPSELSNTLHLPGIGIERS